MISKIIIISIKFCFEIVFQLFVNHIKIMIMNIPIMIMNIPIIIINIQIVKNHNNCKQLL